MEPNRSEIIERIQRISRIHEVYLCEDPKFIWLPVPKVAITSIKAALVESGLKLIKSDEGWTEDFDPDVFIWCFVRNPYDRALSMCRYFGIEWENFLSRGQQYIDDAFGPEPRRFSIHTVPNSFYTHIDELPFSTAYRYEKLDLHWKELQTKIGRLPKLQRLNQKGNGHWVEHYLSPAHKIVHDMYAEDFERLNYDPDIQQYT